MLRYPSIPQGERLSVQFAKLFLHKLLARAIRKTGTKEKALLLKASFGEQPGKELHNLSESY